MVGVKQVVDDVCEFAVDVVFLRQVAKSGVDIRFLLVGDVDDEASARFDVDIRELHQCLLAVAVDEI